MSIKRSPAKIGKGKSVHMGVFTSNGTWTKCVYNANVSGAGALGAIVAVDAQVTCKKCLKRLEAEVRAAHVSAELAQLEAVELDRVEAEAIELDHAEALAIEFSRTHQPHWCADWSGLWVQDGQRHVCDIPVRNGAFGHAGACYDRVTGVQRHALTLSARQRKADRRRARMTLRDRAPQVAAAARARRVRLGAALGTAKTLLTASGVPHEVAQRFAPAFSKGTQTAKAKARQRKGPHSSKRVDVKRYTWGQFAERLATYRPQDSAAAGYFACAAQRVA